MGQASLRFLVAAATAAALAGCGGGLLASFEASPETAAARQIIDTLARGEVESVSPLLDVSLQSPGSLEKLRQLAAVFPKTAPARFHMVGFNKHVLNEVGIAKTEDCVVTFESNYADANVLSTVTFKRTDGGPLRAIGLDVSPLVAPLEVINAVTLRGKGPLHYVFMLLVIGIVTVTVAGTILWFRRFRSIRRRWWWLLAILVGAFKISFDWTSGAVVIQPLTIQLLSLSFEGGGANGPLILSLSLPVGAVAFLVQFRRLPPKEPEPSTEPIVAGS